MLWIDPKPRSRAQDRNHIALLQVAVTAFCSSLAHRIQVCLVQHHLPASAWLKFSFMVLEKLFSQKHFSVPYKDVLGPRVILHDASVLALWPVPEGAAPVLSRSFEYQQRRSSSWGLKEGIDHLWWIGTCAVQEEWLVNGWKMWELVLSSKSLLLSLLWHQGPPAPVVWEMQDGRGEREREREWLWDPVGVDGTFSWDTVWVFLPSFTFQLGLTDHSWAEGLQQCSSHKWSIGNMRDMGGCLRHQCVVGSFWSSIALEWGRGDAVCLSVMLLSQPAGITANGDLLNLCKAVQYHKSPLRALLHEVLLQRAVSDWFFHPRFFSYMNVLEEKHIIPNVIKSFGRGLWCFGITPSYSRMRSVTRGVNRKQLFCSSGKPPPARHSELLLPLVPTGALVQVGPKARWCIMPQ